MCGAVDRRRAFSSSLVESILSSNVDDKFVVNETGEVNRLSANMYKEQESDDMLVRTLSSLPRPLPISLYYC